MLKNEGGERRLKLGLRIFRGMTFFNEIGVSRAVPKGRRHLGQIWPKTSWPNYFLAEKILAELFFARKNFGRKILCRKIFGRKILWPKNTLADLILYLSQNVLNTFLTHLLEESRKESRSLGLGHSLE